MRRLYSRKCERKETTKLKLLWVLLNKRCHTLSNSKIHDYTQTYEVFANNVIYCPFCIHCLFKIKYM